MYLLIDLSKKKQARYVIFDSETNFEKIYNCVCQDVLLHIDEFLKIQTLHTKNILGIAVVVGTGTFTATRVATTIANTFAFIYQIPLLAVSTQEAVSPSALVDQLKDAVSGQYISATYSGQPHIFYCQKKSTK